MGPYHGVDATEVFGAHRQRKSRGAGLVRRAQRAGIGVRRMQPKIARAAAGIWLVPGAWRHAMPVRAPRTRVNKDAGEGYAGDVDTRREGDRAPAAAGE